MHSTLNITLRSSRNKKKVEKPEGFYSIGTLTIFPDIEGYGPINVHLEDFTISYNDSKIKIEGRIDE